MYDVAIIGCGIVGAAVAYELSRYDLKVIVLEKENDVSCGTSRANSGIMHAGYDPKPGTLMAKLNVEGAHLAKELAQVLGFSYEQCGSLVLAFSQEERETLRTLYDRGLQNGVEGMELWDTETLRSREPGVSEEAVAALYASTAAIVIPWEMTLALAETAVCNGTEVRLDSGVTDIQKTKDGYLISTVSGDVQTRFVVNAAGLFSDKVHNMVAAPEFRIIPERGEYYLLDQSTGGTVHHVVFQCPTAAGKGVLVAPTTHGSTIAGPTSEFVEDASDVATTAGGLERVRTMAHKSIPSLAFRENIRNFSGNRATVDRDDFIIAEAKGAPGFFDLAGIKSPGLTAAPAIGKMTVELLHGAGLALQEKEAFVPRPQSTHFSHLTPAEKQKLVAEKPAFGRIICRCESVTEGQIFEAFRSPIPPRSVDGIKRRCDAGLGRCQGGFCGPRIVELLYQELGVSPLEVLLDTAGSYILTSETKGGGCNA